MCAIVQVSLRAGVQMCQQPHLIIDSPYVAGYRTHHPRLCLRSLRTGVGQQRAVLLEEEGALYSVCVRLERELGYSHTGMTKIKLSFVTPGFMTFSQGFAYSERPLVFFLVKTMLWKKS